MKILIAEDNAASRRFLETRLIKWGYDVVCARDGKEAWGLLQADNGPKVAILDWLMPEMDGLQVCRKVRNRLKDPYVYILLLTAKDQKEHLIEAMEAGVDDYIAKPFEPHELRARLLAARRIIELHEDLVSTREALRIQATHDSLTGLWNRPAILDVLHRELARAKRQGTSVGIAMADLDHFKQVNDTYGHAAGDTVLRKAARRMLSVTRAYDTLGRYGGEEFLIVIPRCDEQGILGKGERIRSRVCEKAISLPEGTVPVTISVGVTVAYPFNETDAEAYIRVADEALYRAKAQGRNRVELVTRGKCSG